MTTTDLVIEAEGLVKHFGETKALQGVDLAVSRGTVLGVLGPNGAGKTTAAAEVGTARGERCSVSVVIRPPPS